MPLMVSRRAVAVVWLVLAALTASASGGLSRRAALTPEANAAAEEPDKEQLLREAYKYKVGREL